MRWLFGLFFPASKAVRKMCKDKVRFKNEPAAKSALQRINPKNVRSKPRRAYKCPHCRGYHLTRSDA